MARIVDGGQVRFEANLSLQEDAMSVSKKQIAFWLGVIAAALYGIAELCLKIAGMLA